MIKKLDIDLAPEARVDTSESLGREIMARQASMKSFRQLWECVWQDIRELIRPNASDFTVRSLPGYNRKNKVFDDFPGLSLSIMAAGLHSYLTTPSSRWFEVTTRDRDIDRDPASARWLEIVSNRIYDAMNDPDAGFNSSLHELYLELGAFGTGVILLRTDELGRLRFKTLPLSECFISENEHGVVDTLFREFEMTTRQAELTFGNKIPDRILACKDPETPWKFIHATYPMKGYWKSVYLTDRGEVLSDGRFKQFPYLVVRWSKISGELYGRSPSMDCLQHVRVLNESTRIMLQSSQLQAAPPLLVDDDGTLAKVELKPWAIFFRTPGSEGVTPLPLQPQLAVNLDLINRLHDLIARTFYNDLFNMPSFGQRDRVTAAEIIETRDDRLRQLAPVLSRLEIELLNPIIERIYLLAMEHGNIPDVPPKLKDRRLKVSYLSPAVRAQRSQGAMRTMNFLQQIIPYSQMMPGIADYLDMDGIIKEMALGAEVPRYLLKTDEQVKQVREGRKQQEEMAQMQQMAQTGTQVGRALKDVAAARQDMPELAAIIGGQ
jgi:hypothetical protein